MSPIRSPQQPLSRDVPEANRLLVGEEPASYEASDSPPSPSPPSPPRPPSDYAFLHNVFLHRLSEWPACRFSTDMTRCGGWRESPSESKPLSWSSGGDVALAKAGSLRNGPHATAVFTGWGMSRGPLSSGDTWPLRWKRCCQALLVSTIPTGTRCSTAFRETPALPAGRARWCSMSCPTLLPSLPSCQACCRNGSTEKSGRVAWCLPWQAQASG